MPVLPIVQMTQDGAVVPVLHRLSLIENREGKSKPSDDLSKVGRHAVGRTFAKVLE